MTLEGQEIRHLGHLVNACRQIMFVGSSELYCKNRKLKLIGKNAGHLKAFI